VHYFKTAGGKEFTFIWIGDIHNYSPIPKRLTNAVNVLNAAESIAKDVDFILSTGDVVAWGGSYSFWKTLYEQDFIKDYAFANVLGNHDAMTRQYFISSEFFRVVNNVPNNGYGDQGGVSYWFLYDDVLFIMLNNEVMKKDENALAAAQEWAGNVIRQLKGTYRHIFICEHYQWFDGRSGKTGWYADWKDFCDEHGVALALSGNNHIYKRTYLLHRDQVVKAGKGTIYMEVPSSDGDRGVRAGTLTQNQEKLAYTWSSQQASNDGQVKTIGCVLVKVKGNKISTKLVHIDEQNAVHVADEHTVRMLTISP
jgi:calcineurin-like phosphoesterase family protein